MAQTNPRAGLQALAAELGQASLRSKLTVLLAVLAVVGVLGVAGVVAGKPHYVMLYSGLGDGERVAVEKALAGAQVSYRASQPPGPFSIYVDEGTYDQAQIAVAMAEALRSAPAGITTGEGGAGAIFMSSGERQQSMLKREWQETEHLLQQLDFVSRATVTTSMPDSSPLRKREPVTVSVALTLKTPGALRADEASAVAKLVRYRFGVPPENVIISDQSGHILYDPSAEDQGPDPRSLIEHAAGYDSALAAKVNRTLEQAFGPSRALVTVTSEWDHDQSTTVSEAIDPETVTLSTERRSSKTPLAAADPVGGVPGTSSNMAPGDGFGTEHAGVPELTGRAAPEAMSETSDERTTYDAARTRTQTVRTAPRLARLSVSLVLDDSLGERREQIVQLVKAAVGFDETRQDLIGVSTTAFAVPEEGADGAVEGEPAAPAEPSPVLELLLTRGVEIVSALAFVTVLLLSLRGARGARAAPAGAPARGAGSSAVAGAITDLAGEVDPALLARAQIDELVRSNPRRVGEILSRWASEETAGAR